jgi:hypothetical protein
VEQLRLGAAAFLRSATTGEVRRIAVLDAAAVLDDATRSAVIDQYSLGMLLEVLGEVDAAGRLAARPVEHLAPILMAGLHEAAMQVAGGAEDATMIDVINHLIDGITKPAGS